LELEPCADAGEGEDIYPRLVVVSWYVTSAFISIRRLRLFSELYLRRPGKEAFRLDKILKRKAEEGVKVFVIL